MNLLNLLLTFYEKLERKKNQEDLMCGWFLLLGFNQRRANHLTVTSAGLYPNLLNLPLNNKIGVELCLWHDTVLFVKAERIQRIILDFPLTLQTLLNNCTVLGSHANNWAKYIQYTWYLPSCPHTLRQYILQIVLRFKNNTCVFSLLLLKAVYLRCICF